MLNSLETSADETSSAAPVTKPVKLNAVVTKGNIRVVPKPSLQIVAAGGSVGNDLAESHQGPVQADAAKALLQGENFVAQPAVTSPAAPWKDGFSDNVRADQTIESELLPQQGPPMKMIKLIAAATVLGVAAIALTFLQFSGSDQVENSEDSTASQGFNAVIAAAGASTLPTVATPESAAQKDGNTSDIVAQITAGTLAALRNGSDTATVATPSATQVQSEVAMGDANGLYAMVLTALQQGQSRQYIDQMVNEAHRAQEVKVPAVLLTSSGDVNTSALLTLFGGQ